MDISQRVLNHPSFLNPCIRINKKTFKVPALLKPYFCNLNLRNYFLWAA